MTLKPLLASLLTLGVVATTLSAPRHRDPLTQAEIDQVRDSSWDPGQRLPLYVKFARARLVQMETMRADPKAKDRVQQTHDLLDDFQLIYDELNDNIETYVDRKDDIRKPLKLVMEADTEFQAKLRALNEAPDVPSSESQHYEFVLSSAIQTLDNSSQDHRKLAEEQEESEKHKKAHARKDPP